MLHVCCLLCRVRVLGACVERSGLLSGLLLLRCLLLDKCVWGGVVYLCLSVSLSLFTYLGT